VPREALKKIKIKQKGKKGYLYFLLSWQWQPKKGEKKRRNLENIRELETVGTFIKKKQENIGRDGERSVTRPKNIGPSKKIIV
jgi:hypothetical protein